MVPPTMRLGIQTTDFEMPSMRRVVHHLFVIVRQYIISFNTNYTGPTCHNISIKRREISNVQKYHPDVSLIFQSC
jgi:hypothetical protein